MITKQDLPELALIDLKYILDKPGEIIYSSHETLKKGDLYLLGLNPGEINFSSHVELNQKEGPRSIRAHLQQMLSKNHNSYTDEDWSSTYKTYQIGEAPLQKRVKYLLKSLGHNTEDVCASNIIFVRSKDADSINFGLAGYCWKFHERILEIIQPKLILCFGTSDISAFSFLKSLLPIIGPVVEIESGHGIWKCKTFTTNLNNQEIKVVGIPHLSYYDITTKPEVIEWISNL